MEQINLENRLTTLEMGLAQVAVTVAKIESLTLTVHSMAGDLKRVVADNCSIEKRLRHVEEKPAKRWDNAVMTLISSIISLLIGAVGGVLIYLKTGG